MNWVTLGLRLGPAIFAAVQAVEKFTVGIKGKQKQDAAVQFVQSVLAVSEFAADKDLLDNVSVDTALRGAINAVVAVQNAVTAAKNVKK